MIEVKLTHAQRLLVDEYAEVRQRCLSWAPAVNPDAARFDCLHETIMGLASKHAAKEALTLRGVKYVIPISKCKLKRTFKSIPVLFKRLGAVWVAAHCKPTLSDVEKAIPEAELPAYILSDDSGPRTLGEPVKVAQAA